jgi:hypothetical protein
VEARSGAVSDERGRYQIEHIPPGVYTLTIAAEGFVTFSRSVTLSRSTTTVDATLRIGGKVDVEVRPDAPAIATDARGSLSSFTLMGKDLDALSDNPALMMQRLREMAGSRGTRSNIAVYIDGMADSTRTPRKDTIEMIRIVADPFAAEFAEPDQRKIQISTKPGAGAFNGDGKFTFRDRALTARNAFAPTRPPMQFRNYSGYVSGPIVKQRWGFLLYGGRWEQNENAVIHATVLDPVTAAGRPFSTTIATPTRASSVSGRTDYSQGHQRLGFVYSFSTHDQPNQGLSGLELPEFALNRTSFDDMAQLSVRSFGDHVFNELSAEVSRVTAQTSAALSTPAIVVFDAFSTGGNPGAGPRQREPDAPGHREPALPPGQPHREGRRAGRWQSSDQHRPLGLRRNLHLRLRSRARLGGPAGQRRPGTTDRDHAPRAVSAHAAGTARLRPVAVLDRPRRSIGWRLAVAGGVVRAGRLGSVETADAVVRTAARIPAGHRSPAQSRPADLRGVVAR